MATRPAVSDVVAWARMSPAAAADAETQLDEALAAAVATIEADLVDEIAALGDEDDTYPDAVRLAVMMHTLKLYRRHQSPEGIIAGFEDIGAIVVRRDPDVVDLLARHLKPQGFA